jgi:hypothetical protein
MKTAISRSCLNVSPEKCFVPFLSLYSYTKYCAVANVVPQLS